VVAVFPEGSAPRPWPQRYRIGAFGRGGFVKVALRAGAAIVPCAVVGSEEASPLSRPGFLADVLGLPLLSGHGLPLGPLGGFPLPSRWWLRLGEPVDTGGAGPEAAADPDRVARITELTRTRLQALIDQVLAERRSVFL
jgi:1-acyl-sn-glycerol-3-phosphate acyltransferase